MDSDHFDTLVRSFGEGTTRRSLTRLLGGLALSGLLPSLALAAKKGSHQKTRGHHTKDGHAKKGGKGKDNGKQGRKDTDRHKQGNDRTVTASASANTCSRKGTTKCSTVSQCSSPALCQTSACTAGCCALTPAPDGTICGSGQVCQGGQCVSSTPPCDEAKCLHGQICVNGACGCDTSVTCGYYCSCPQNQGCTSMDGGPSQCACDAGLKVCDESGHCVEIGSAKHCADCYDACGSGQVCWEGQCVCPEWTKDCNNDGTCVPLGTDQNCADCNDACTDGQVCAYRSRQCVTPAVCGNGTCEAGENCGNCPADCGKCPPCTDNWECVSTPWCHPTSCVYWAEAPVAYGGACDAGCLEGTLDCGQGYCECQVGECVAVATEVCGDGWCLGSETCSSCPTDCGECPA